MLREIWILFATCLKFFLEMGCFLNRQRLFVGKTSWKFYLSKVVLKKWGYRNGCPPIIYLLWHLTFAQFTTKRLASFHWLENFSKAPLVNKLEPKIEWINFFGPMGYLPWFHSTYCIFNVTSNLVYLERKIHYVLTL